MLSDNAIQSSLMIHNPWKTDIDNIDSIDIDIADIDIPIYQYIDIDQASPVKGWQFFQSESHLLQPRAHISEQTKISKSIIWKYHSTTKFHLVQIRLVWSRSYAVPFEGMAMPTIWLLYQNLTAALLVYGSRELWFVRSRWTGWAYILKVKKFAEFAFQSQKICRKSA